MACTRKKTQLLLFVSWMQDHATAAAVHHESGHGAAERGAPGATSTMRNCTWTARHCALRKCTHTLQPDCNAVRGQLHTMEREERPLLFALQLQAIKPHADLERNALFGRRRHGVPEEEVKPTGRTRTSPRAVVQGSPVGISSAAVGAAPKWTSGRAGGLATPREPQVDGEVEVANEKLRMRGSKKVREWWSGKSP